MAPKPQNHNPMNLKNILSRFPIPEYPSKSRISNYMKDSLAKNGKDKVASLFHGLLGHIFSRILSRPCTRVIGYADTEYDSVNDM